MSLPGTRPALNRLPARAGSAALILALGAFILGPLMTLVVWAFAAEWFYPSVLPQTLTLDWWPRVLQGSELGSAIGWSFVFAPTVTLVSAALCLPAPSPTPGSSSPASAG